MLSDGSLISDDICSDELKGAIDRSYSSDMSVVPRRTRSAPKTPVDTTKEADAVTKPQDTGETTGASEKHQNKGASEKPQNATKRAPTIESVRHLVGGKCPKGTNSGKEQSTESGGKVLNSLTNNEVPPGW